MLFEFEMYSPMCSQYTQFEVPNTFGSHVESIGKCDNIQNVTSIWPVCGSHAGYIENVPIEHFSVTFSGHSECNLHVSVWANCDQSARYIQNVPTWAHCDHILSVITMYSTCTWWVFGFLTPVSVFPYVILTVDDSRPDPPKL